jgi:hypothetical protein
MKAPRLDGTDWHFRSDAPPSFGCNSCYLLSVCGGLRVKGAAFDCQRFCCHKPDCQIVCFNSPANYAERLKEVDGFNLNTIPKCEPVAFEPIRGFVPLIHHAYSRNEQFFSEIIAISLYELLDANGASKYHSREDITRNFRISPKAKLVISGIQKDYLLERVWRSSHRNSIVALLKSIGVAMFTAPNFSVYNNVPRPENLYNIKRIGLFSQEFLAAGVPTALHINACTDADYNRYSEFLSARTEFQAISFDFITGPGYPSRTWWHTRKLIELRNALKRQIQLVLRGGTRALNALSGAYSDIVIIDSKPLHTALHRHRMIFGNDGHIKIVENHLPRGTPVDGLLSQNVAAARSQVDYLLKHPRIANSLRAISRQRPRVTRDAYDETGQLDLLTNSRRGKPRANAVNTESVIATPKSEGAAEIQKASKEITKAAAMAGEPSKPRSPVR